MSIKDHPAHERMRQRPPAEIVRQDLGDELIEEADDDLRRRAFRSVGRDIIQGRTERTKRGFPSDTNGEIARALEWAFKAGRRAENPWLERQEREARSADRHPSLQIDVGAYRELTRQAFLTTLAALFPLGEDEAGRLPPAAISHALAIAALEVAKSKAAEANMDTGDLIELLKTDAGVLL